jgi:L-ascorbate metabolism protein UlaG (beta-lactamase superfamily)
VLTVALDRDTTFTWYGHSCLEVTTPGGKTILIDPWFSNPKSPKRADEIAKCDVMLLTHGHFDHIGEAIPLASRLRPTWPCIHEMSLFLGRRLPGGNDAVIGMNKGGRVEAAGIGFTMVPADHSSGDVAAGMGNLGVETPLYLGEAAGFVIELENGFRVYLAGDTTVFGDMRLIRELYRPELAILPMGGHFTMGPREAALAAELVGVRAVLPVHYGTFPVLTGTPAQLREELAARGQGSIEVFELEPGATLS